MQAEQQNDILTVRKSAPNSHSTEKDAEMLLKSLACYDSGKGLNVSALYAFKPGEIFDCLAQKFLQLKARVDHLLLIHFFLISFVVIRSVRQ